jgi:hypothetical protein
MMIAAPVYATPALPRSHRAMPVAGAAPLDLGLDRRMSDPKIMLKHFGRSLPHLLPFTGALVGYENTATTRHKTRT